MKLMSESDGAKQPDCWGGRCIDAEAMSEDISTYLDAFFVLKSDILASNGVGARLLEQAEVMPGSTRCMMFAVMDAAYQEAQAEQRRRD